MEFGRSSSFGLQLKPPPLTRIPTSVSTCTWRKNRVFMQSFSLSYQKFINFALEETKRHIHLVPSPLQENFNTISCENGEGELRMLSFQAAKIRLLRSLSIETETMQSSMKYRYNFLASSCVLYGSHILQEQDPKTGNIESSDQPSNATHLDIPKVLDFAVFPEAEYGVPIFCANFFATSTSNIVVLDLNPLHDIINQHEYKEKYYKSLIPLGQKYAELLPWGGKLTSESIRFFSPIVIWTKFAPSPEKYDVLYSAFRDYYKVWLQLIGKAIEETDSSQILHNREAQHKYLTWRTEKDPGQGVLKKLIGKTLAKELLRSFLFNGVDELGSKKFLDYFPEYCCEDGTVNNKRSIVGKSFENRPWNARGEFIGNNF